MSYTEQQLRDYLRATTTIALVGASPRPERDSYRVMQSLLDHGFAVIPVNPREAGSQILGQSCVASLAAIEQPVDMVDIFRNAEAAYAVTEQAIAIGAKLVWMQLGVVNHAAAALGAAAGVAVVMDRCPKIELEKPGWAAAG